MSRWPDDGTAQTAAGTCRKWWRGQSVRSVIAAAADVLFLLLDTTKNCLCILLFHIVLPALSFFERSMLFLHVCILS